MSQQPKKFSEFILDKKMSRRKVVVSRDYFYFLFKQSVDFNSAASFFVFGISHYYT